MFPELHARSRMSSVVLSHWNSSVAVAPLYTNVLLCVVLFVDETLYVLTSSVVLLEVGYVGEVGALIPILMRSFSANSYAVPSVSEAPLVVPDALPPDYSIPFIYRTLRISSHK